MNRFQRECKEQSDDAQYNQYDENDLITPGYIKYMPGQNRTYGPPDGAAEDNISQDDTVCSGPKQPRRYRRNQCKESTVGKPIDNWK